MKRSASILAFCLLCVFSRSTGTNDAFAQFSRNGDYRSRGIYISLSKTSINEPIMFLPGDDRDEFALPQRKGTFGLSAGYEWIREKAGVTIGLDYISASFDSFIQPASIQNPYPDLGSPTVYQNPTYTLLVMNIGAHYFPFPTVPASLFANFDLGMSVEKYRITGASPNASLYGIEDIYGEKTKAHGQFGFGLGSRIFISHDFSLFINYRWEFGEGKPQFKYDHEDDQYIYYKQDGYDLKGPTSLFLIGLTVVVNKIQKP